LNAPSVPTTPASFPQATELPNPQAAPMPEAMMPMPQFDNDTAPEPQWYVRHVDGQSFGPVDTTTLNNWVMEGRLTGDSLLQQCGSVDWYYARDIYPVLGHASPSTQVDNFGCSDSFTGYALQPVAPEVRVQTVFDSSSRRSSVNRRSRKSRETDMFAVICFMSGLLSLLLLPIVLMPLCYITGTISYYRLKENPNLKGQGLRLIGWVLGSISFLYLLWVFQIGPFARR